MHLGYLLPRTQEPEERRADQQACEVQEGRKTTQCAANDQEFVLWACHALPLAA
jgi:hypothetical protein